MSRFVKREINSPQMRSVVVLILCTYFWIYLRPPQMLKFYTFFFGGGAVSLLGGAGPTRGTGNSNSVYRAVLVRKKSAIDEKPKTPGIHFLC